MKRIAYTLLALGLVGSTVPAMAENEDNKDTIATIVQSQQMLRDGTNMKALKDGQRSIADFWKVKDGRHNVINVYDLEGTNQ